MSDEESTPVAQDDSHGMPGKGKERRTAGTTISPFACWIPAEEIAETSLPEPFRQLMQRVSEPARDSILKRGPLYSLFNESEAFKAYIVAVDLRRSTDLMLKAREAKLFAKFMSELADRLKSTILSNLGVYDKFTGDGILAYFPEFYSGPSAGLLAVDAAEQCHRVFSDHYRRNQSSFQSVPADIGLGIGIDYGEVTFAQMQGELTVIGRPVVYACRLSSAESGETVLNQQAYDELRDGFSDFVQFEEKKMDFKHEGPMLVHVVSRTDKVVPKNSPDWMTAVE